MLLVLVVVILLIKIAQIVETAVHALAGVKAFKFTILIHVVIIHGQVIVVVNRRLKRNLLLRQCRVAITTIADLWRPFHFILKTHNRLLRL